MVNNQKILVLGAGVSGLSTAIFLQQAGFEVTIWAKEFSPDTTSDVAAAFWYPYLCEPKVKVVKWGKFTLDYVNKHLLDRPEAGCRKQTAYALYSHVVGEPWWAAAVESYEHVENSELPAGYLDGYKVQTVLMDSSRYMPWLMEQFTEQGGESVKREVTVIDEVFVNFDIVVNCTGLGSAKLLDDKEMHPVRGQVVKAAKNGFETVISDDETGGPNCLAYIIPRFDDIVLGGTANFDDWNLQVNPDDSKEILRKAEALNPKFKDIGILTEKVGLRPGRSAVRVESESRGNRKWLVHNYGHGGAGYTLSWGCADEVLSFVQSILNK